MARECVELDIVDFQTGMRFPQVFPRVSTRRYRVHSIEKAEIGLVGRLGLLELSTSLSHQNIERGKI